MENYIYIYQSSLITVEQAPKGVCWNNGTIITKQPAIIVETTSQTYVIEDCSNFDPHANFCSYKTSSVKARSTKKSNFHQARLASSVYTDDQREFLGLPADAIC